MAIVDTRRPLEPLKRLEMTRRQQFRLELIPFMSMLTIMPGKRL